MDLWKIREPNKLDINFIYATWLKSYRYGSLLGKSCRNLIFFDNYSRVIDGILSSETTKISVAYKPDDPDLIFGYSVQQPPDIIHFVFTKQAFTGYGIAKALIYPLEQPSDKPVYYTHATHFITSFVASRPNFIYNPFLLFKQGAPEWQTKNSA
jgi:hypothetical protein